MAGGLRQYIAYVRKLEIQKQTLEKSILSIDKKINDLAVPGRIRREDNPIEVSLKTYSIPAFIAAVLLVFGIVFFFEGIEEYSTLYYSASGMEYGDGKTLCIIGLVPFLIGLAILIYIMRAYKQDKMDYMENEQIIQDNYRIDKENDEYRVSKELAIKQNYQQIRNVLYNTYVQTCNTLNILYDRNVIYPKYQNNLVAICMFYEYLESRRCTKLTGHEGAYNIYEQELRLGIIVEKLDIVIRKLDEIQNNQYALYTAIRQINNQQLRIINSLNKIEHKQDVQNQNLEYVRYNTEALKLNSDIAMIYSLY